jgi:hypothetical protein
MFTPYLLEGGRSVAQSLRETVPLVGCQQQLTIEACLVFRELGGRRGERGIVAVPRIVKGGLCVGKLRRQLRFAPRQAVDIGTGEFVGPAHILEVGAGVVQSMEETVTLARALRQLVIESGLALREFGSRRGLRRLMLLLRRLSCRLAIGKLRHELRFALRQALDVGSGRLVVLPCLCEGGVSVAPLLREAIAIGRGLRELAIEMGLALGELGSRGGQRGVVALVRIAQSGLAIGNGLFESVASRLNVGQL